MLRLTLIAMTVLVYIATSNGLRMQGNFKDDSPQFDVPRKGEMGDDDVRSYYEDVDYNQNDYRMNFNEDYDLFDMPGNNFPLPAKDDQTTGDSSSDTYNQEPHKRAAHSHTTTPNPTATKGATAASTTEGPDTESIAWKYAHMGSTAAIRALQHVIHGLKIARMHAQLALSIARAHLLHTNPAAYRFHESLDIVKGMDQTIRAYELYVLDLIKHHKAMYHK